MRYDASRQLVLDAQRKRPLSPRDYVLLRSRGRLARSAPLIHHTIPAYAKQFEVSKGAERRMLGLGARGGGGEGWGGRGGDGGGGEGRGG